MPGKILNQDNTNRLTLHTISLFVSVSLNEKDLLPYSLMLKELDQEGVILSGGEQQKLMFTQCLYKNSPVLILDCKNRTLSDTCTEF